MSRVQGKRSPRAAGQTQAARAAAGKKQVGKIQVGKKQVGKKQVGKKQVGKKPVERSAAVTRQSLQKQALPGAARMEDLIQVRLFRLSEIVVQMSKRSTGARGLRYTDLRILNLLFDAGELSINELARRSHVDKAWISRSVTELLAKKWVTKRQDPADSRAQLVKLTAKSRSLLEEVQPIVQRNERRLLDGIDERRFKQSLDRLAENAANLLEQLQDKTRKA